jgi:thiol-disulfide isomerase/thioredoxin
VSALRRSILGLILTGAALHGANARTSLLLAAYAAGAATSLALASLIGGRVYAAMKRSLGVGEWIRRSLGVAVLGGVAVIALGLDTSFLTRVSLASTAPLEQGLVDKLRPAIPQEPPSAAGPVAMTGKPPKTPQGQAAAPAADLPVEGQLPSLSGAVAWLNSPPLTPLELKDKVVVVDFWTYSCINCLRAIPYVRAWAEKYKDQGLVVIGVHSPEFAFEKTSTTSRRRSRTSKSGFR